MKERESEWERARERERESERNEVTPARERLYTELPNYKRSEDRVLRIRWGKPSVLISHCRNKTVIFHQDVATHWTHSGESAATTIVDVDRISYTTCCCCVVPGGSLHGAEHQDRRVQGSQLSCACFHFLLSFEKHFLMWFRARVYFFCT